MSFKQSLVDYVRQKRQSGHSFGGVPVYDLTISDATELENLARKYQFPAEWLANLINHESAGTFNPAVKNPASGATGIIQFMPRTAASLGTSTSELANMSFKEQLKYTDRYLSSILSRAYTGGVLNPNFKEIDLYMAIFYPVSMFNPNYQFPSNVVAANGGIRTPMDYYDKVMAKAIFKNVSNSKPGLFRAASGKISALPPIAIVTGAIGITLIGLFIYSKYSKG